MDGSSASSVRYSNIRCITPRSNHAIGLEWGDNFFKSSDIFVASIVLIVYRVQGRMVYDR